jgi:hypothetical protein
MSEYGNLSEIFGAGFDTGSVEPQGDFQLIPPGKYLVVFDDAEIKQTKAGTGHYLKLTMTFLDGEYRNRKLWDNINVQNPSAECVEIGLRKLAAVGVAIGEPVLKDTAQIVGKKCIAHIKVKDEQNQIRTYSSCAEKSELSQVGKFASLGCPRKPEEQADIPSEAPVGKPPWLR